MENEKWIKKCVESITNQTYKNLQPLWAIDNLKKGNLCPTI